MPTSKQRRQAAQRHLQRQLERRAEQTRKRRRNIGIVVTTIVVVVRGRARRCCSPACSTGTTTRARPPTAPATVPTTSAAATTNADGTISCTYSPDESGNPNLTDVGTPPDPEAHPDRGHRQPADEHRPGRPHADPRPDGGPVRGGQLRLPGRAEVLRRQPLPPRWSTSRAFGVLQCGDPTGTGSGGPTYKFAEEITREDDLPARHDRDGEQRAPARPAASSSCASSTPSCAGLHRRRHVDEAGLPVLETVAAGGQTSTRPATAPPHPGAIETMTAQLGRGRRRSAVRTRGVSGRCDHRDQVEPVDVDDLPAVAAGGGRPRLRGTTTASRNRPNRRASRPTTSIRT